MQRFEEHIEVACEAEEAFALLADYGRDAEWRAEVVEMTPSPPGPASPGTETREVARMMGRTFVTPGRVTSVVPGRSLTWQARSDGLEARGERAVTSLGQGRCGVTLSYELRLLGPSRLFEAVLGAAFRRRVRANQRGLRSLLEAAVERSTEMAAGR